jgi:hypothetical protein
MGAEELAAGRGAGSPGGGLVTEGEAARTILRPQPASDIAARQSRSEAN